jgi:hypothetical protein
MRRSEPARCYVVIPEGLSVDKEGKFYVSDHYMAALDLVAAASGDEDRIWLAPANDFGAGKPEDHFGLAYLREKGCRAVIGVIDDGIGRRGYLDTLDNASYLRKHLRLTGNWPLGGIILVCNRPHVWRGWLMFRLCGYRIEKVKGSRPAARTGRKMVKRLWFYDVPAAQYIYEAIAIVYDSFRFLLFSKI